jgi:hypothetical protein
MRLTFGPHDDEQFDAARTALLARFETWPGAGDYRLTSPGRRRCRHDRP